MITLEYHGQDGELTGFETGDTSFGSVYGYLNYNSHFSEMYIKVLRASVMLEGLEDKSYWYKDIAKEVGITENESEIMKYCLAKDGLIEYGGSPRGGWATDEGVLFLEAWDKENLK